MSWEHVPRMSNFWNHALAIFRPGWAHVCHSSTSRLPKTLHSLKVTQLNLWDLLLVSTPLGAMSVQFIYHFEAWFGLLLLSGYPKL